MRVSRFRWSTGVSSKVLFFFFFVFPRVWTSGFRVDRLRQFADQKRSDKPIHPQQKDPDFSKGPQLRRPEL